MKTAINIIGYNRIHYFNQVVESLSRNIKLPTFVYLDNCGDNMVIQQHVDCVKKFLPHAQIIIRQKRYGCEANIVDANNSTMEKGFDQMFVFEDDTVVSSTYVELCMNLAEWVKKQSLKIGMVQGWPGYLKDFKSPKPNEVVPTLAHAWGYLIFRQTWLDCKQIIDAYRNLFKFVMKSCEAQDVVSFLQSIDYNPIYVENIHHMMRGHSNASQDGALATALMHQGYHRVALALSRAEYIGVEGIHGNQENYERWQFGKVQIYEDQEDRNIRDFSFIPESLKDIV